MITNSDVREFWEQHPVAAKDVGEVKSGSTYFEHVDQLREAENCEPYRFANAIHGFESSADKRVLDVGCGHGYVLSQYARHGAEVHGVDLTSRAIQLSKERFDLNGLQGDFHQMDGVHLPFPDKHFDIACSMGVLHHIAKPRATLAEMHRVLKPGGRLILMLYHKNSFRNQVTFRWRKYFGPEIYNGKSLDEIRNMNDGAHCPLAIAYDRADVESLLRGLFDDVQFRVNKLPYEEVFLFTRIGYKLARLLPSPSESFLARRWGWNLYIQATRI